LGVFDVIHEEIMQIGNAKTSEDYVVLGKMKNEDSRGLRRFYEWRNSVPKFHDNLDRSKHLNMGRNMHFQALGATRHMRPEHEVGAWSMEQPVTCARCMKCCFMRLMAV
jgi:hypothetical protein